MSINAELKQTIRERANYICKYCHSPERLSANRFTVAHVIPRSLVVLTNWTILHWLVVVAMRGAITLWLVLIQRRRTLFLIFNPRKQKWTEHFIWLDKGVVIKGITPIGRATCLRLDLNDTRYPEKDSIRETRRFWIQTKLHPPADDPHQA